MPAPTTPEPDDVSLLMSVLRERWVLTLATLTPARELHATPLFYAVAVLPACAAPLLVFASRADSSHGRAIGDGPTGVAAAIYLETEDLAQLRGAQLHGEAVACTRLRTDLAAALRAGYLERHPLAAPHLGPRDQLYVLAITWARLVDNRRGFGSRLHFGFASPWRGPGRNFFADAHEQTTPP
jgi:uncharacterized protein YhbP (UPF0306 family)